jgi:hypothetical protein
MSSMMDGNMNESMRELQMNKMKYCMHKDDIAIGLGRPMYGASVNMCNKKAYPSVISTMGGTNKHVQAWMAVHNFMAETYEDTSNLKNRFVGCLQETYTPIRSSTGATFFDDRDGHASCHQIDKSIRNTMEKKINNMLEFYFVGVSLGIAYAHQHSGDTVASVMVGGLKTVLNGAFQVILVPCVCWIYSSKYVKYMANLILVRCIPMIFSCSTGTQSGLFSKRMVVERTGVYYKEGMVPFQWCLSVNSCTPTN